MSIDDVRQYHFEDDGIIPNNPYLPVLVYPGAFSGREDQIEDTFNQNNWKNSWVNGVFDFHHYHSNTHEVLGVREGQATLQIGGEKGQQIEINSGDILILPAGTGHKRLTSTSNFKIVGAYPDGMEYNTMTEKEEDRLLSLKDIPNVPLPDTDPVYGLEGPLLLKWRYNEDE
jgi:uncharacterized protein YjlB